ncbi:MAG TPA: HmuY family protein [Saprospiraceae bacterium]|nr:HmuY family protein [Saprospiraceae bacterium]
MKHLILVLFAISLLTSCDDSSESSPSSKSLSVTVQNLPADPPTSFDPTTGQPIGETGKFTFFRLSDSSIVANSDSTTSKWDIAFRANTILINSGSSGPGSAGAFLLDGVYQSISEVPADSSFHIDQAPVYAIGKNWYTYDQAAFVFYPKPGKVLILRTSDQKYAKLEILSYYKNAPTTPNYRTDLARYYTFRYIIQQDGSKKF